MKKLNRMNKIQINKNKLILFAASLLFLSFLFFNFKQVSASNNSIVLTGDKTDKDVNIRYDITISSTDISSAQQLNPSCLIDTWTINSGFGKNDNEANNLFSQGNASNTEIPIGTHHYVFSDIGAYDVLNSNGYDRVMLYVTFTGNNCDINYPLVASPILFSDFPFSF